MEDNRSMEIEGEIVEETPEEEPQDKSFTQDEVNNIIKERLAREKEKTTRLLNTDDYAKELDQRERAIIARELRANAKERLQGDSFPVRLAELLSYENEEAYETSYKLLISVMTPFKDDVIKEIIKGEPPKRGTTDRRDDPNFLKSCFEKGIDPNKYLK